MKNQKETIRKFVTYVNNKDHLGGFWLPNIQRHFVWKEEQIERLYDSILREYPIGSMLVWKTDSEIKHRKFIDNWKASLNITDFYNPENGQPKMLVLDGQQRTQSLFIGLMGKYNNKELYLDILSGDPKDPEDIRYNFKFLEGSQTFPWIKFKEIVFSDKKVRELKKVIAEKNSLRFSDKEEDRIEENLEQIKNVFCFQENVLYQVVDSIDSPTTYSENDVVEIFIRANSGGTPLNKSDLMFSLLLSSWENVEENMMDLLQTLNTTGYKFNRDFILKTFLVLLGKGARYNVQKFREEDTREMIEDKWGELTDAVKNVKDFVYGSTYMKTDKNIPSYLSLIPLIHFNYKFKNLWASNLAEYQKYLLRTSLTGVFGGTPDNLLDKLVKRINENQDFQLSEIFGVIREDNRGLELSREMILSLNYWKKEIHLLFNLWYGFNYQPAYKNNLPQIDHIFPQSELKKIKKVNPSTGRRDIMKYPWEQRDQIGNLMLLTAAENGAGGKADNVPEVFFEGKPEGFLELHLIPKNKELWKMENYESFIDARKKLIVKKFEYLLQKN